MRIAFYGAAHEVTGSCTVISAGGKNILIDCGMEQGPDIYENGQLPVLPGEIDYVLLTHAHIDHSGKLPALTKGGFHGHIYATRATAQLCGIMLMDSAHIQESEARWRNRKAKRSGQPLYEPLYTGEDVSRCLQQFVSCNYGETYTLCRGITVSFTDAGHLLGSSSISLTVTEAGVTETIVFSGDLGNRDRPLLRDPGQPLAADYVVVESTYGDRLHGPRPDYVGQLTRILQETFDRQGNVVIPSFAIGRTQELLYLLRSIKEQGLVHGHDGFPVYVDSPLAIEATELYSGDLQEYFDEETLKLLSRGVEPIRFPELRLTVTSEESMQINLDKTPKVILSASGMCEAGRIRHHLKHNLWRPESTVLFVGYQSAGTLGRILLDGADSVKLFGEPVQVKANIEQLDGISGHADRDMILDWLRGFEKRPKTVFVNHGEDSVCDTFAQTVQTELGLQATAPYWGAEYDLISGVCLKRGNSLRLVKPQSGKDGRQPSAVYQRLLTAGKRLTALIGKYREAANKDISKFADQLLALCDKWER